MCLYIKERKKVNTLFSKEGCSTCMLVEDFLKDNNINYTKVLLLTDFEPLKNKFKEINYKVNKGEFFFPVFVSDDNTVSFGINIIKYVTDNILKKNS